MTVRQLATAMGVSHAYISAVELGHQVPTATRVVEFAKALGLDSDELCQLAGHVPPDVVATLKAWPALLGFIRAVQQITADI
jgi:transcriptional regulator with XRE-family HTH domain